MLCPQMGHNAFPTISTPSFLRIDHKPLERFATVSNTYECKGRWISMLQDFHFKIVNHAGCKHANVDVLNKNPVEKYKANEDFGNKIQDLARII